MLPIEIRQMYEILVSFLGPSKLPLDDTFQLQFSCPRCQEREGSQEVHKYHLEVNLANGYFHCWKCSSIDQGMQGTVYKLIRQYGSPDLLKAYKEAIKTFRESSLYQINFDKDKFQNDYEDNIDIGLELPKYYEPLKKDIHNKHKAYQYLTKRGIDWSIIEEYHIGFTTYHEDDKSLSNRIILPSFDAYGDINYWTARDFTENKKRQRYYNPVVERKDIIFNEDKIQWNADITLVEGPFDHIVVPNSMPLLGKSLDEGYKMFQDLFNKAHANINIMLDNDAIETALSLYKKLNQGRLKGRIKFVRIPVDERNLDPSKIFELYGRKGVIQFLNSAQILPENYFI